LEAKPISERCRLLLLEVGYLSENERIHVQPLTGGIASDIALVTTEQRQVCVKFALPKLKVDADWFAPVHRNAAEYAWLQFANSVAPESAVQLIGWSEQLHGFAMEYLDGDSYLWKTALLDGFNKGAEATKTGELLGQIHSASASTEFDDKPFQNKQDFHALRIEPYLIHTASKHPDVEQLITEVAEQTHARQDVLLHGDVSPKNIIFKSGKPHILDAECATMGDAAFDPAFCINHLVLKAIHLPNFREPYLQQAQSLWRAYRSFITWEPVDSIEQRICVLLPMLMLARVDGKSPVEYLSSSAAEQTRQLSMSLIQSSQYKLDKLLALVGRQLQEIQ